MEMTSLITQQAPHAHDKHTPSNFHVAFCCQQASLCWFTLSKMVVTSLLQLAICQPAVLCCVCGFGCGHC